MCGFLDNGMYQPVFVEPEYFQLKFWRGQSKVCIEVARVFVAGEEYDICEKYSHERWSNQKVGSTWSIGILNKRSTEDPRRTERTGLLGEMAFAKVLRLPVDVGYRVCGDKQDFLIADKGWDVKNATHLVHDACGLVKSVMEDQKGGKRLPITDKHGYLFSYIENEDRPNRIATIVLVGAKLSSEIAVLEDRQSRTSQSNHLNKDVPYESMVPIREVIRERFSLYESLGSL